MSEFYPLLVTVHPWSPESLGDMIMSQGASGLDACASAPWPANNRALLIPFRVYQPETIVKLGSLNGATASGNIDMGIYDRAFTRLVSIGSTAQAGTTAIQEFDITDILLGTGQFYLAVAMSSTAGTLFRRALGQATELVAMGMTGMASAFPLPATVTPDVSQVTTYIPLVFATTRSLI